MGLDDETAASEITILPDGRVFVLGASRQVLEILELLSPEDAALKQRLKQARDVGDRASAERRSQARVFDGSTNAVSEECRP